MEPGKTDILKKKYIPNSEDIKQVRKSKTVTHRKKKVRL